MPITVSPLTDLYHCVGAEWTISDELDLARQIAAVAVGQSRHVERIFARTAAGPPSPSSAAVIGAAVAMLTAPADDPYHRDGWVFQIISWLAALRAAPTAPIRAPQMGLAEKGFDGLQLDIDTVTGRVAAAIIFEDKATATPRKTIRQEVWPAILDFEAGKRDNRIVSEVSQLVSYFNGAHPERTIEDALWAGKRAYRVSVTVDEGQCRASRRRHLFKGYDDVVPGDITRRQAGLLKVAGLRSWMAGLSSKAIECAQGMS